MTAHETNTYIQGFIELDRQRHTQRWKLALTYAAIVILLLFGTGTVTLISQHPELSTQHSSKVVVDLAACPPLTEASLPIVTFTIAMRGDGTPELQGCQRWKERPQRRAR